MDGRVLVVLPVSRGEAKELEDAAPGYEFVFKALVEDPAAHAVTPHFMLSAEEVAAADIIIGNVSPKLAAQAPHLKWIQLGSAGADAYLSPGVLSEETRISTSVGCYGQAVAEHCFALLLSLQKKLYLYEDDQRAHIWGEEGTVSTLDGARVIVMGAGDIGTQFAKLCCALGADCRAYRRHAPEAPSALYQQVFSGTITSREKLFEALPETDVVASFLPSTASTRRLVDAEFLAALPRGAFLVNGGRGDLIDYAALTRALELGTLAGCGIDVADPEPLPEDSALWDCPNLLITPHVAGFWHLPQTRKRVFRRARCNLERWIAGEPLVCEMDRRA